MLRPMRPKPLIPTLTAIADLRSKKKCGEIVVSRGNPNPPILMNGLRDGQTPGYTAPRFLGRLFLRSPIQPSFAGVRPPPARRFRTHAQMYFLYTLLVLVFFAVLSPYFAYQAVRYRKYIGSLPQRLGFLPVSFNVDGDESIWVHAVSVGEALTARALVGDLKAQYPRFRVFLSTTTMAGQQVARREHARRRRRVLLPVRPRLHRPSGRSAVVKPRLFVMMETEIWPNLLRACRRTRHQDRGRQRPASRRGPTRATG